MKHTPTIDPVVLKYIERRTAQLRKGLSQDHQEMTSTIGVTRDAARRRTATAKHRINELAIMKDQLEQEETERRQHWLDEHPGPSLRILPIP